MVTRNNVTGALHPKRVTPLHQQCVQSLSSHFSHLTYVQRRGTSGNTPQRVRVFVLVPTSLDLSRRGRVANTPTGKNAERKTDPVSPTPGDCSRGRHGEPVGPHGRMGRGQQAPTGGPPRICLPEAARVDGGDPRRRGRVVETLGTTAGSRPVDPRARAASGDNVAVADSTAPRRGRVDLDRRSHRDSPARRAA